MDISEIKDRETLEAWLQGRSHEDAVAIAARAALRVLPVYWQWSLSEGKHASDLLTLQVLRCTLISMVAAESPPAGIARAANSAVATAYAIIVQHFGYQYASAMGAAEAAIDAATTVYAGIGAATGLSFDEALRLEVQTDCVSLENGKDLFALALWSSVNFLGEEWQNVLKALEEEQNDPGVWRVWRDWYTGILNPVRYPPSWEFYRKIALIEDETWEAGPEAISKRIEEIKAGRFSILDPQRDLDEKMQSVSRHVEQLERAIPKFLKDLSGLEERFEEVEGQAKGVNQDLSATSSYAHSIADHTKRALEKNESDLALRFQELQKEYENKIQARFDAFHAANRIKAPVDLWSEKEIEHKKSRKLAFTGFVVGLIVIAAAIVWVGATLLNPSENLILALSPVGCDLIDHPELCKGFSFRGMILSGSVLTLLTLALWFTRIQMKQYLSERHLVLDARERRAFAQTYIGLIEEGDTSKEAQEQRALVYAALFRPSSDGIIKDEGGIDPSLTAALSKLLAGK
ncbi:DUF6161 domain-containing protein [Celeribacter naphthalenivorans]|uniref:DUF6161 domain-containing protein n=1 Tax=Celeribacter naphthalenivorans TaxID=1614694 RepID=UPI001CFBD075|nr:DUF6161 domain-containing protein [Celeribacter naphthalenivorans]